MTGGGGLWLRIGVTRTYIVAMLALLLPASLAAADPSDRSHGPEAVEPSRSGGHAHEHDYSRFSDGPRRVPTG